MKFHPAVDIYSRYDSLKTVATAPNQEKNTHTHQPANQIKSSHNCISRINKRKNNRNSSAKRAHTIRKEQIKFLTLSNRKIDAQNVQNQRQPTNNNKHHESGQGSVKESA